MNFELSEELRMFGDQLRRALDTAAPLAEARACINEGRSSSSAWNALVEAGVSAATISETYGGLGLGPLTLCVAAREIGWSVAGVPAPASLYLFAPALGLAAVADVSRPWLPDIAAGSRTGTAAIRVVQPARLADGLLNGAAAPVPDGMTADAVLLLVDAGSGPTLVLVDLAGPGVSRTALPGVDPARPLARLGFAATPAIPIGDATLASAVLDQAAVYLAFEQVGCAERALDSARRYALERHSFGRPIGGYQAIKHRLADMWVKVEIARAHMLYAGWALDSGSDDLPLAAAAARVAATDACLFAAQECLQIHGGFGFTFEADCHLFYRRARSLAAAIGSARGWGEHLAAQLIAGAEPVH